MKFEKYKQKVFAENPEVREEYDNMKFKPEFMKIIPLNDDSNELKFVPVDDMFCEMMNWAVRYSLGRRTYAVSDTIYYITKLIPFLTDKTIYSMIRDIESKEPDNLGDHMDTYAWIMFKSKLIAEQNKRNENK